MSLGSDMKPFGARNNESNLLLPDPYPCQTQSKWGGGGTTPFFPKFAFFCTCHNFPPPLSSVQIIIIPACCLLCVL